MQARLLSHFVLPMIMAVFVACTPVKNQPEQPTQPVEKQPASKPAMPSTPPVPVHKPVTVSPVPKPSTQLAKPAPTKPKKIVMGWVEYVNLTSTGGDRAKAKLDSGAKVTSLNAKIIKTFKRDKKTYVLFRVILDDESVATLERQVLRYVRIKKKEGGFVRRPVVEMSICLGGQHLVGEVNLADRDHFIYPILIGRNMLKDGFLIDSSRRLTSKPVCQKKS